MYLELAENGTDNLYLDEGENELYLDENGQLVEGEEEVSPYIFVPGQQGQKGVYVREDYFDDLPDQDWERLFIELEAQQPGLSLFGLGKKGRARRAERRDRRSERKLQKIETRASGRAGVARAGGGLAGFGQGLSGLASSIFGGGGGGELPPGAPPPEKSVLPWVIGGVAVIGLGALLLMRKKK